MTLKISNLSAGYGSRKIIDSVSFEVKPGKICLVIGHNGAGKSTLMNAIYGSLKPSAGESYIDNEIVSFKNTRYLAQRDNVFLTKTLEQNLLIGLTGSFILSRHEDKITIFNFLNKYFPDIANRIQEPLSSLSGGMRQMAAIARTLLSKGNKFVLMDEPTLGLSAHQVLQTTKKIKEFGTHNNVGMVIVEHKLNVLLPFSDWIVVIRGGRVTFQGSTENIFSLEDVRQFYF